VIFERSTIPRRRRSGPAPCPPSFGQRTRSLIPWLQLFAFHPAHSIRSKTLVTTGGAEARPTEMSSQCEEVRPDPPPWQGTEERGVVPASVWIGAGSAFLCLPAELHYLTISQHLPWHSVLALRQTCRYFSTLLSPSKLQTLRQEMARRFFQDEVELRRIWWMPQWWAISYRQHDHLLGLHCFSCMRQLHPIDFVREQTIGGCGLGRACAAKRWCKACGLKWGQLRYGKWYRECDEDQRAVRLLWLTDYHKACAQCLDEPTMTWWGCVGCFAKEERRRQKEDWDAARGGCGALVAAAQKWRRCKALWKRRKAVRQQADSVRSRLKCHPLTAADRRAAEREDEQRVGRRGDHNGTPAEGRASQSREKRWQTRCWQCWEPNCQPRPSRTSMVSTFRLPREQWCDECIADDDHFVEKRKSQEIAQAQQTLSKRSL
jgi:hypothetical protein